MRTSVCVGVFALVLGSVENGFGQGPRHFCEGLEAYHLQQPRQRLRRKRDSVRALRDYDEALRLNPKYAGAMRNRGLVHAAQGDYDHAIRDFSEAARLDPDDPHAGRGLVHCARHAFTDAERDFDAALRICPSCSRAIAGRAAAAIGNECR